MLIQRYLIMNHSKETKNSILNWKEIQWWFKIMKIWEIQEWLWTNKLREITKVLKLNTKAPRMQVKDHKY